MERWAIIYLLNPRSKDNGLVRQKWPEFHCLDYYKSKSCHRFPIFLRTLLGEVEMKCEKPSP